MSSRKGNVIFLDDVLRKAIEMVKARIAEKNPTLPNSDKISEQVGIGAIVFNDLVNDRVKNVDFDWDRVLDFEGDSGPYVQYMFVRCQSLIRKAGREVPVEMPEELTSVEETELIRMMLNFEDTIKASFDNFKPHILAQYLLELCRCFSQFYTQHRILGEPEGVLQSRLALVGATRAILARGLELLNMSAPEAM